jgi:hypothetical protein
VSSELAYPVVSHASAREKDYEVVFRDGPFSAYSDLELTEREQAFLKALESASKPGSAYAKWAAKARHDWHERTGTPRRDG